MTGSMLTLLICLSRRGIPTIFNGREYADPSYLPGRKGIPTIFNDREYADHSYLPEQKRYTDYYQPGGARRP
jgi:hypothetical protein